MMIRIGIYWLDLSLSFSHSTLHLLNLQTLYFVERGSMHSNNVTQKIPRQIYLVCIKQACEHASSQFSRLTSSADAVIYSCIFILHH